MIEIGKGGRRLEDHFVEVTDMIEIGKGGRRLADHFVEVTDMFEIGNSGQRAVRAMMMSRYACDLVIQNADPAKEIVGQVQPETTHTPATGTARRGGCVWVE